jgi:hypothetical protein
MQELVDKTRQTYVLALHHFMKYLGVDVGDYDKLLDKDTKLIKLATNGVVISDAIRYVQTKVNHLNTISDEQLLQA